MKKEIKEIDGKRGIIITLSEAEKKLFDEGRELRFKISDLERIEIVKSEFSFIMIKEYSFEYEILVFLKELGRVENEKYVVIVKVNNEEVN